jgi:sugar O-acyltransferase (sialic acid O-acetyltransferase NeuD family)
VAPTVTEVLIGGAGGLARETVAAVRACIASGAQLEVVGFLDDNADFVGQMIDGSPVVGPFDALAAMTGAHLVLATGRPDNYVSRHELVQRCALPPSRYVTVVHPGAQLGDTVTVGVGTIALAAVVATASVAIGSHVVLMPHAVLTHDDIVGDFATIASGVLLGGSVHVGEGAYLGAGSVVREGVSIGAWAMVGMGSIVTRDVPPGELWMGSPARYVRDAPVPAPLVAAGARRSATDRSSG